MGSADFSTMVHSSSLRATFVSTAVQFLKARNFDGLDLDWEYPGKCSFTSFCSSMYPIQNRLSNSTPFLSFQQTEKDRDQVIF